jgi:hypothetical protein
LTASQANFTVRYGTSILTVNPYKGKKLWFLPLIFRGVMLIARPVNGLWGCALMIIAGWWRKKAGRSGGGVSGLFGEVLRGGG